MKDLTKMWFPDWYECKYNEKVLALANHLGRKKGGKDTFLWDDPEYVILEAGCDDDMAEVGCHLGIYEKKTAEEIAKEMNKPLEYVDEQLKKLAYYGVAFWNTDKEKNVDVFWAETWIPGTMEVIVNSKENCEKYPIIGYAMEAYGRVRGPKSSGAFPVGVGLMRVIPIESAIDGNSHAASYEEVSKYLEENDVFTVTDCSCRTDRELMGEGCGHLKEDMCIQMGHAAEYYIKTGRGRQITREEAYEIIRKAEENGLMHQIPNTDGNGKTHAICNCCGCGCLSLRTAEMFKNNDMVRSNYVARVETEKCVACGQCVENCPVNALKMGQKLCSSKPVIGNITTTVTPRDRKWTKENWNPDYRINREDVVESGTAPCKTNCPAHIAVQGYIKLASQGRCLEALDLIKKENPLPAVCGRICNRRCEDACTRGDVDEPIAIDEIKKFIAEQELDVENRIIPTKRHDYSDKKIAIVGAGPAGLACAYYLALDGYSITVFEKSEKPGGMLTMGIPSFRLEKDVVEADYVLLSIGQSICWGSLLDGSKVELRRNGTAEADGFTYQTAEKDIFVGGDVYTGPRFAIDAIAAGKQGAISIHRFVQPGQSLVYGRDRRVYRELDKEAAVLEGFDNASRQRPEKIKRDQKECESFRDFRGTFTEEQMKKETERCLGCGATIVDDYMCVGCGQCTTKCKFDAIHLERVYDGEGVQFLDMKPVVVKNMVKRQGKIMVTKVKDAISGRK